MKETAVLFNPHKFFPSEFEERFKHLLHKDYEKDIARLQCEWDVAHRVKENWHRIHYFITELRGLTWKDQQRLYPSDHKSILISPVDDLEPEDKDDPHLAYLQSLYMAGPQCEYLYNVSRRKRFGNHAHLEYLSGVILSLKNTGLKYAVFHRQQTTVRLPRPYMEATNAVSPLMPSEHFPGAILPDDLWYIEYEIPKAQRSFAHEFLPDLEKFMRR